MKKISSREQAGLNDQPSRTNIEGPHDPRRHGSPRPGPGEAPLAGGATQVDTAGKANHPALAVSPLDNSLTVAWVSEANAPQGKILTRARSRDGTWGTIETASTADVWTSTSAGINIDQGPSLIIGSNGVTHTKHLAYIQDTDGTGDYGRIHYAVNNGAGWTDTALNAYSHDPALALNSRGEIYIIGHGHPKSSNTACTSMDDMCTIKKNTGTWGVPQLFAAHPSGGATCCYCEGRGSTQRGHWACCGCIA